MNKSKINFIIDVLMFLSIMALSGTGFLKRYIFLSGQESKAIYGRKVDMYMLGISKNGWSNIHLYLGFFILFLLVLHIYYHWNMIPVMYKKLIDNKSSRAIIMCFFIIISILLLIFPFLVPVQVQ